MRGLIRLLLLALALALATALFGWWAVPLPAALWGALRAARPRPALEAAAAAALGWLGLLGLAATRGPVVTLADQLGAIFNLPGPLVIVFTLVFPALLAGSAAGLTSAIRAARVRPPARAPSR